jgi:dienelactone hydrolase
MDKWSAILLASLILFGAAVARVHAEVITQTVAYRHGDAELQGYLAWDDGFEGPRPGVIVVHEWWGLTDYVKARARKLAQLGYVAFAADMYGDGKVTEHPQQAGEWMRRISANVQAWQARARRGLEVLRGQPRVDAAHIAAIGYCFGGATVMQMAYSGADLDGVVSFHGSLPVATPEQARSVKAHVLAAHGSADAFVPAERIQKFQTALNDAGVDWQMIIYGGARHAFTNPNADQYGMDNLRYDERADRRSWQAMRQFFGEIFGDGT